MAVHNASYNQAVFRGRNDDGSETAATWIAAENTDWSQSADTLFRVRFKIEQTVTNANANLVKAFKVKVSHNGGAFTDAGGQGTTTQPVRYADSTHLTDGENTTEQLTSLQPFIAGDVVEVPPSDSITFTEAARSDTEIEAVLEIVGSNVSADDTLVFRLYESNDTALATYTVAPTVTVSGSQTYTGTLAVTQENQTSTASGTVAPPAFTGTSAPVQDSQTSSASGAVVPPAFTGTLAVTQADQTSTASGAVTGGGSVVFSDDWTGSNGAPWDSGKWTISQIGTGGVADIQGNRGRIVHGGGAGNRMRALSIGVNAADVDVLFSIQFAGGATTGSDFYVWARADAWTDFNPTNGYGVDLGPDDNTYTLRKSVAGTDSELASTAIGFRDTGDLMWMRFQVNGTTIRVRTWLDIDPEPGTWDMETTDSDISSAGEIGVVSRRETTAQDDIFLDDLEVVDLAVSDNRTGTSAPTQADQTSAASGTVTLPAITGTSSASQDPQVSTASGTHNAPGVTGSLAVTQDDQTSTASGAVVPPAFTGTSTATQDGQTSAASGTVVPPAFSGTSALAQDNQTSSASGLVGEPSFTGTSDVTQQDQFSTASGTVVNSGISGTLAASQENQVATSSGTVTPPSFTGTADPTQDDQTSAASGTFSPPGFTGTSATVQDDQTSTASGTVTTAGISGTLAVTQDDQTSIASGTNLPAITGTMAVTQDDQVLAAAGGAVGLTFWTTAPVPYTPDPVPYEPLDPDAPPPW